MSLVPRTKFVHPYARLRVLSIPVESEHSPLTSWRFSIQWMISVRRCHIRSVHSAPVTRFDDYQSHWQFIVSSTILLNIAQLHFLGRTVIFIVPTRLEYQKTLVLHKRVIASRNHRWSLIANRKKRLSRLIFIFIPFASYDVDYICFYSLANVLFEFLIKKYEEK